jgi:N-acetyl-gamma-glutamyl-phosphate reductase
MAERTKIFIDGASGTVGLQIRDRLQHMKAFDILKAPSGMHRDIATRKTLLNEADIAVLCMPDRAAVEAVTLIENTATRVLDASSAHRVAEGWVYGLPELSSQQQERIATARFVANPGCFATGAIVLLKPLIEVGIVPRDYPVSLTGVTGYTAGGHHMIERYESGATETCRHAVLTNLDHRHIPEIQRYAGLAHPPACMFSVSDYPQGMVVQIPLALWALPSQPTPQAIHNALFDRYGDKEMVKVRPLDALEKCTAMDFDAAAMAGCDDLEIFVAQEKTNQRAVLIARFDNLGKGASGAAVQNLELMSGIKRKNRVPNPSLS